MAFKNALKNLVAHFGVVWALLLYIFLFAVLIAGLSLPFIMPIARAFGHAGVFAEVRGAFSALFGEGGWQDFWGGLYNAYMEVIGVFESNDTVVSLTMAFLIFVVIIAYRFFLGLYTVPLATVLDGKLSCNASYGLGGKFFSTLSTSARFSAMKMLVTTAYDALIGLIVYGLGRLIGMNIVLPFVLILVLLVLLAFKYAALACWAPCTVNGDGVIKGFVHSLKIGFKHFGSFYSTYFVTSLLVMAIGMFIAVFTLGVGLIIVVPFAAAYYAYIDITEFYNKTGRRYYIDGTVYNPPVAPEKPQKEI